MRDLSGYQYSGVGGSAGLSTGSFRVTFYEVFDGFPRVSELGIWGGFRSQKYFRVLGLRLVYAQRDPERILFMSDVAGCRELRLVRRWGA